MEQQATKKHFLLVDDDPVSNFLIERMIISSGLSGYIDKVPNGREALQHVLTDVPRPDVILLDINMPIMNGFEFLEAFNSIDTSITKNILVILLSSSDDLGDIRRAGNLGIRYYLNKPLRTDRLKEILNEEFSTL